MLLLLVLLLLVCHGADLAQRPLPLLLDVLLDQRADGARNGGAPLVVLQQLPRSHTSAEASCNIDEVFE